MEPLSSTTLNTNEVYILPSQSNLSTQSHRKGKYLTYINLRLNPSLLLQSMDNIFYSRPLVPPNHFSSNQIIVPANIFLEEDFSMSSTDHFLVQSNILEVIFCPQVI